MERDRLREGDVVLVDRKGRHVWAIVEDVPASGPVAIRPIVRGTYRSCTPKQIIGAWRRLAGSAVPTP